MSRVPGSGHTPRDGACEHRSIAGKEHLFLKRGAIDPNPVEGKSTQTLKGSDSTCLPYPRPAVSH